ncbi:MAG: hypothetical protein BGO51_13705 [Rhodospirillales bacterium 69-11]|nr:MAG: hypothetical protein BGO51_13705 [Rhodospirillales bacterium 69-11]
MASPPESRVFAEQFAIELASPLHGAAGGLTAYAAADRQGGAPDLMAVAVPQRAPPRLRALQLLDGRQPGLLAPLGHGVGPAPQDEAGYYVVTPRPPGAALADRLRPWSEAALIEHVLRPVAHVLERMEAAGVTHRGIRLDNVFQARDGHPVVLGQAWATPPAMLQPALYEPPYSAMCLPAGRGEGTIADDVYALGALLLVLSLGEVPAVAQDDAAMLRRKIEVGSFHAIAGESRLPAAIADLARGMLAEDPDHRPTPALLLDPSAARGRRVAARPPRRAQRPFQLAGMAVWDTRTLAFAMAMQPEQGLQAMVSGTVTQWLRRGLGDAGMGSRLDEMMRHRAGEGSAERGADAFAVMRMIVLLDPLAPLCWRGIALWPDGLGSALAAAIGTDTNVMTRLDEIVATEAIASWATLRPDRCDHALLRMEARQHRALAQIRGPAGGLMRLAYTLCPLLPCGSPLVAARRVVGAADLPPALEAAAKVVDQDTKPVDAHIAAFLAARSERRLETETNGLVGNADENGVALARLRLLAQLQLRYYQRPLPALCGWVAAHCQPLVDSWQNRPRRAALEHRLKEVTAAGFLPPIVGLFEDAAARAEDAIGAQQAAAAVARIDAELAQIEAGGEERAVTARRIGQEIAAGAGLLALASMLAMAAFG